MLTMLVRTRTLTGPGVYLGAKRPPSLFLRRAHVLL